MIIDDIAMKYNFVSVRDLRDWCHTFVPDKRPSESGEEYLVTDGDSGLAEVDWSDIYGESGVAIRLIECAYCDFDMYILNEIWEEIIYNATKEE